MIVGWMLEWLIIIRISTDYIPMAPGTAISFFILSIALLIYTHYNAHPFAKILGAAGALFIFSICFIILATFVTGSEFDIEQVIYPDPEEFGATHIGRMSPLTAIDFLLGSCALLFLLFSRNWGSRAKSAAAFVAVKHFGAITFSDIYYLPQESIRVYLRLSAVDFGAFISRR
ncbi:MAG: hypothetical protein KAH86_02955 [Methanosarcinales archaeon]|nr:hypothetical protein [Methanosarcinales archaeon]